MSEFGVAKRCCFEKIERVCVYEGWKWRWLMSDLEERKEGEWKANVLSLVKLNSVYSRCLSFKNNYIALDLWVWFTLVIRKKEINKIQRLLPCYYILMASYI